MTEKLVYTTETGQSPKYVYEVSPDTKIYKAAELLAAELSEQYAQGFQRALERFDTSPRVVEFLHANGMDQPRVQVLTFEEFQQLKEEASGTNSHLADKYAALPSIDKRAVIVNFQLPKPLDIFWDKHFWQNDQFDYASLTDEEVRYVQHDYEENRRIMNEWGPMYESLMGVPWHAVDIWEEKYGGHFSVSRLNGVALHANGDKGFYYLFTVSDVFNDNYNKDITIGDYLNDDQPDDMKYGEYDLN